MPQKAIQEKYNGNEIVNGWMKNVKLHCHERNKNSKALLQRVSRSARKSIYKAGKGPAN